MRVSNIFSGCWQFVSNGSDKKQLAVIYTLALLDAFLILCTYTVRDSSDTESYFFAAYNLTNGLMDYFRTPVYPIVCLFAETISASNAYRIILMIQLGMFIISIYYLFHLCKMLVKKKWIVLLVTILYACLPHFMEWTLCILTESLATSLLIIFCYYIVKNVKYPCKKYSLICFFLINALIYLRPIFIFLLPILFVLWCYSLKQKERLNFKLNTTLFAFTFILYLGYCSAFKSHYGLFTTSVVSTINQYDILRRFSHIDTDVIDDKNMREDISKITNTDQSKINDPSMQIYSKYEKDYHYNIFFHRERDYIAEKYGYITLNDLVKNNIKKHWREYLATIGTRITRELDRPTFNTPRMFARNATMDKVAECYYSIFNIPFFVIYLTLAISFVVLASKWYFNKNMPIMPIVLWLIVFANLFTSMVGAQAEYGRLMLPSMPIYYILMGIMIDYFVDYVRSRKVSPKIVEQL